VQVNFSLFNLAPGDVLIAYDGDSTSAPFIGSYGSFLSPTLIEASTTNSTGCLTFVFTSNQNSPTAQGWEAQISCTTDCQTITNNITAVPAPDADGILRVCQGDMISFTGSANFASNSGSATYQFNVSDGRNFDGNTADIIFDNDGAYWVDFIATDIQGCRDTVVQDILIFVSTTPDFSQNTISQTTINLGDTVQLTGAAVPSIWEANYSPPSGGTTFLPDGVGISFQSCVDVTGLLSNTMTSGLDLKSVFLNIEHSYLGDLDIVLIAPNGNQVSLFERAGGGTFLGLPIDDESLDPGIGFDYFFTERSTATETWAQAAQAALSNNTIPEGDYLPSRPFSELIGTDLNGTWCIEITDNLARDNGYLFDWSLRFDDSLVPPAVAVFTPGEVDQRWLPNSDILSTSNNGTEITVQPSELRNNCYTYEYRDDFGCVYYDETCVFVCDDTIIPDVLPVFEYCAGGTTFSFNSARLSSFILSNTRYSITGFYSTESDARNGVNQIFNINLNTNNGQETIYARFDIPNTFCVSVRSINVINTSSIPLENPADIVKFDANNDGFESFDLTSRSRVILSNGNINRYPLAYYLTQNDAINQINPIQQLTAYQNLSNPQTIYVGVEDDDTTCTGITSFDLRVFSDPSIDSDGDGVLDIDEDLNNDGDVGNEDTDQDGTPNYLDNDDDNDLIPTAIEIGGIGAGSSSSSYNYIDTDGDRRENYLDIDDDGDLIFTINEDYDQDGNPLNDDTDNDGIPNFLDEDDDNDTVSTSLEVRGIGAGGAFNVIVPIDTDNDQIENYLDDDDDGDGLNTIDEDYNLDGNPLNDDTNNNQIPDFLDDTVTLSLSNVDDLGIEIYPTMVDDRITIKLNGSTLQNFQVSIVDFAGKQIISTQLENSTNEQSIDLSNLKQGMYLLLFNCDSGLTGVRKIVKK
jgi:subtilisin-like proprotein convertase family protein